MKQGEVMEIDAYLERIGYSGSRQPGAETLRQLHRAHMFSVPFENFDIPLGQPITLSVPSFYDKIVRCRRGGFCYELNGLFGWLLEQLGFAVVMLSARVFDGTRHGPEFDHLLLLIEMEERWIADVGFGDSFLEPLRLDAEAEVVQRGSAYRLTGLDLERVLERRRESEVALQYAFSLTPRRLAEFSAMNHWQQTSAQSNFTQKAVCTMALADGRITLSNSRLILTAGKFREERQVASEPEYRLLLKTHFGIELEEETPVGKLMVSGMTEKRRLERSPTGRPVGGEYADYASDDIAAVPGEDAVAALVKLADQTPALFTSLMVVAECGATSPGKWKLKDVLGHLIDDERIFSYRILCIARGEQNELPGFEQEPYVANGDFEHRALADLLMEYVTVRTATVTMLEHLPVVAWSRRGRVNGYVASVRGLAFHIAGHELHHLRKILSEAGVPKGSFYRYFESKENFGVAIIESSVERQIEWMRGFLEGKKESPLKRLQLFLAACREGATKSSYQQECVASKLGSELGQMSEPMRKSIRAGMARKTSLLTECIREGQVAGEIDSEHDPKELAAFIFNDMEGTRMRMGVDRTVKPMDVFTSILFDRILPPR